MPTHRLYYDDPTLRSFDATVIRRELRRDESDLWLDRTAFYPASGGQPHDLGMLAGLQVLDVQDDDAGGVRHVVRGAAPDAGTAVHGDIEWQRRFDHMQQHTGQHLLSAVIEHAFGARTVSFHLGAESSTIDLDRELTPEQIAQCELAANQVIWRDVAVTIRYASEEEARALPLRKESARAGTLRLIDIDGIDLSACGGTHVARTGSIGQLVVSTSERFKGGQRLEFLCGGRALARFQQLQKASSASIRLLSVLPADLPGAIERLQQELKDEKRALGAAQLELARYQAVALAGEAEAVGTARAVLRAVDGDVLRLKALASAVATHPDVVVVLVSRAVPLLAVAARASTATTACNELIGAVAKEFGGRGGGKPDLAQCGGLEAQSDAVLAFARDWIASH